MRLHCYGSLCHVECFLSNITVPSSRVKQPLENGTNRLSLNGGKKPTIPHSRSQNRVLISVLRYKSLILVIYHPDTIYTCTRMWGSVVIFKSRTGSISKKVGKHSGLEHYGTSFWSVCIWEMPVLNISWDTTYPDWGFSRLIFRPTMEMLG